MNTKDVEVLYEEFVLPTYSRLPVCLVKGKGCRVWDIEGQEYLDFFPGWAVSGLGHCPPEVVNALRHQAGKILHISNNYLNVKQAQLAKEIVRYSFPARVFFCNSGAEAIEGAIKLARKYGDPTGRYETISMHNSFHGRTLGALAATGQEKYQKGFAPLPQGFKYATLNDFASVEREVTDRTVAVLLEPIQGEGGINVAEDGFLRKLKELCQKKDLLLIFDEVQCGMGRTGKMFAYQHSGVEPDVLVLSKALGGGVPIGALVANKRLGDVLGPGTHASTFGGNPLVCVAALAVFKTIAAKKLLKNAEIMGAYLQEQLNKLKPKHAIIKEVRGRGLMVGVELTVKGENVVSQARQRGLLINCTQDQVLRIMPAMVVTKKQMDQAIHILDEALGHYNET